MKTFRQDGGFQSVETNSASRRTRNFYLLIGTAVSVLVSVAMLLGYLVFGSRQDDLLAARLSALEKRLDELASRDEGRVGSALLRSRLMALQRGEAAGPVSGMPKSSGDADWTTVLQDFEGRLAGVEQHLLEFEKDPLTRAFEYARSDHAELRALSVESLRRIARHDPRAREQLRSLLSDPSAEVRREALQALAEAGEIDSLSDIMSLLSDPDGEVREGAVDALRELLSDGGSRDQKHLAASSIAGLLGDSNASVRREAVGALADLGTPESVPALLDTLNDGDSGVQAQAIEALASLGDPSVIPHLQSVYGDGQSRLSVEAAIAMARLGNDQAFKEQSPRLAEMAIRGRDDDARRWAISALARYAPEGHRDVFAQAARDPDERVRHEAQEALQEVDDD